MTLPPVVDLEAWAKAYPEYYGPNAKDPDEGLGDQEVADLISKFTERFTGYGGTFSTWGERHAFIVGYEIGMALEKIEPVPTPVFWSKESHYFKAGIACGYGAKCALEAARKVDLKTLAGVAAVFTAIGTAIGPIILPLIGVG